MYYRITLGLLLVAAMFLGGTLMYVYSFSGTTFDGEADCAVVFGAAVWPGGLPSNALSDRTRSAIALYNGGNVACIVLSGAPSAYGAHEVDVMHTIVRGEGIPDEDIRLDYDGFNTLQTIQNLKSGTSYVFVSNDFHLARIQLLAKQLGVEEYALYASIYQSGRYASELRLAAREVGAFWYYFLNDTRQSKVNVRK